MLSTAEIESALTEHSSVAEAAVVSKPHDIKGECPHAFVTLKNVRCFQRWLFQNISPLYPSGIYIWWKSNSIAKTHG